MSYFRSFTTSWIPDNVMVKAQSIKYCEVERIETVTNADSIRVAICFPILSTVSVLVPCFDLVE